MPPSRPETRRSHSPSSAADPPDATPGRRDFLRAAGRLSAGFGALGLLPSGLGAAVSRLSVPGGSSGAVTHRPVAPGAELRTVQEEPWGRIEALGEGVWALVSTPRQDATTLSNGGIIAGQDGVLLVEGLGSPRGLVWMAERARALTGRWPDHVVVSHYHGDHTAGLAALAGNDAGWTAQVHMSEATRRRTREVAGEDARELLQVLEGSAALPDSGVTTVELGGRRIRVDARSGHTAHDVTVTVQEPGIVFCGDLVWNAFFPNYMDARPTRLAASVAAIAREDASTFVPGHGPVAGRAELEEYRILLEAVEAQAREAARQGWSAEEAAERLVLPAPVDGWFRFSPRYPRQAIQAWMDEGAGRG